MRVYQYILYLRRIIKVRREAIRELNKLNGTRNRTRYDYAYMSHLKATDPDKYRRTVELVELIRILNNTEKQIQQAVIFALGSTPRRVPINIMGQRAGYLDLD